MRVHVSNMSVRSIYVCVAAAAAFFVLGKCANGKIGNTPGPAQLGAANTAAWESFYEFTAVYDVFASDNLTPRTERDKERRRLLKGARWIRKGALQRAVLSQERSNVVEDSFSDGQTIHYVLAPKDYEGEKLTLCKQFGLKASMHGDAANRLVREFKIPNLLEYVSFLADEPRSVEAVCSSWRCSEATKSLARDGDTLWTIRALHPGVSTPRDGSYVDLVFNEAKSFLLQEARYRDTGVFRRDGRYVPVNYIFEVKAYLPVHDQFFPSHIVYTNFGPELTTASAKTLVQETYLRSVDASSPTGPRLGFSFPEGVIVDTRMPGEAAGKLFIQGPGDSITRTFASSEELEKALPAECEGYGPPSSSLASANSLPLRIWITAASAVVLFLAVIWKHTLARREVHS